MMNFKYSEDLDFFIKLFQTSEEGSKRFNTYFDFRSPLIKRQEFNKIRNKIYVQLVEVYGESCMLSIEGICDESSGFAVDHIIPLSTNELNKKIRHMKSISQGKKVPTESYGSNHINNLAIACNKCNGYKKNKILTEEQLATIIKIKKTISE